MLRLLGAFRYAQPILGGLRLRRNTRCYPLPASTRDRSAPQNGLSAAKQRATRIDGQRREWRIPSMPYAPPIDPIFGSGIAIMPPAQIPGRLTSSRSVGSGRSVIFCQRDPHRAAVWLVCNIPLGKLPRCFDNLSMHSCEQVTVGAGLTASLSQGGCEGPLPAFYDSGEARIRTRGENPPTGTKPSPPRTDWVALERVAPGEDLSAPLASWSLSSAQRRRCSLRSRAPVRLRHVSAATLPMGEEVPTANLHSARWSSVAAGMRPARDSQ